MARAACALVALLAVVVARGEGVLMQGLIGTMTAPLNSALSPTPTVMSGW
jgi:hypothetical protein